jgi:hypothetical protein
MENFSLIGKAPTLLSNSKVGCKGLKDTSTLAYLII